LILNGFRKTAAIRYSYPGLEEGRRLVAYDANRRRNDTADDDGNVLAIGINYKGTILDLSNPNLLPKVRFVEIPPRNNRHAT